MAGTAKARLIYSSISASERVAGLGAKGALVYTWLLAHCDDQGRFAGGARRVKTLVVPLIDRVTVRDIQLALEAMEKEGLITRYSARPYKELIQVKDWWSFNQGLRVRERSRYPAPRGWRDRVTERDEYGRFRKERWARVSREREPYVSR
jgi:hypothetical protein